MNPTKEKWLLLIILSLVWGSSFILIKKGLEHFTPYEIGSLRVLIAGLILSPFAFASIKKFPQKRLKWLVLCAITGNFIPMFLFPLAEQEVSSSVAGIINSMVPIFVIIVGALFWNFKTTKRQITGVIISFLGVCVLLLGGGKMSDVKIFPILILLFATFLYAVNVTTIKAKLNDVPAKDLSGFVFTFVLMLPSLITLVLSGFFKHFSGSESDFVGLGYVSLLAIFGTGIAMLLYYRLLKIATPLFASTVTFLMPIVAIMWGMIAGEKISIFQILGGIIIIAGLIFLRAKKAT